jgi:hypothetical protein
MSNEIFLYVFLVLAFLDLYFNKVQRTTILICRIGEMPPTVGGYLNPNFIKFAFPLTLIKWGWVVYWALSGSTSYALTALFISWLASVTLPIPSKLTLPPIKKQIERVRALDQEFAATLSEATNTWEINGGRL